MKNEIHVNVSKSFDRPSAKKDIEIGNYSSNTSIFPGNDRTLANNDTQI